MNLFRKLFGKDPQPVESVAKARQGSPQPASADPGNAEGLIRVYDAYGREMTCTKEQWRTSILPGTIKAQWDNPDLLYAIIVSSLRDGFRAEVVDAAQHLYQTDSQPRRSACLWGIVLKECGRLDEAEGVLRGYLRKHGDAGEIFTNLAKVYAKRNDHVTSEE